MERSKRSLNMRMKHVDDHEVNEDSNLSHSVHAHLTRKTVKKTTTLTDNKKERLRKRRIFNA